MTISAMVKESNSDGGAPMRWIPLSLMDDDKDDYWQRGPTL
jgi:hypothetical protein